MEDKRNFVT